VTYNTLKGKCAYEENSHYKNELHIIICGIWGSINILEVLDMYLILI
jgi:hypothetical protein